LNLSVGVEGIGERARPGAPRSTTKLFYVVTAVFRVGENERDYGALRRR
jgi:hypothetical protein